MTRYRDLGSLWTKPSEFQESGNHKTNDWKEKGTNMAQKVGKKSLHFLLCLYHLAQR